MAMNCTNFTDPEAKLTWIFNVFDEVKYYPCFRDWNKGLGWWWLDRHRRSHKSCDWALHYGWNWGIRRIYNSRNKSWNVYYNKSWFPRWLIYCCYKLDLHQQFIYTVLDWLLLFYLKVKDRERFFVYTKLYGLQFTDKR